jgi:hypothetical protein
VPETAEYFLLLDATTEAIKDLLVTRSSSRRGKNLSSGEGNWKEITRLARADACIGVVAVLRDHTYNRLASDLSPSPEGLYLSIYGIGQEVIDGLLSAIANKPHLVFVHEAVLAGAAIYDGSEIPTAPDGPQWEVGDEWTVASARSFFGDIDERVRVRANQRLSDAGITLTPYRRNAEFSMLAVAFIEDQLSNLLFRVYVPSGRLFENESEELLRLFHDWLTSVRGRNVRRAGYRTAKGRVIEFFAEHRDDPRTFSDELHQFQEFLSVVERPDQAEALLVTLGLARNEAQDVVARYAKSARRLRVDLRQEREKRTLALRHELESDLTDSAMSANPELVRAAVDQLVPFTSDVLNISLPSPDASTGTHVVINQQFIEHAEGLVAQNIAGDAVTNPQGQQIQALIGRFAERSEQEKLQAALHELLDSSAPDSGRLGAKQRLKAFLISLGGKTGQVGLNALQAWVEHQMGL